MGELGERDSSLTISLEYLVRLCLQEKKKKQREEAKREGGRKRERGWEGGRRQGKRGRMGRGGRWRGENVLHVYISGMPLTLILRLDIHDSVSADSTNS